MNLWGDTDMLGGLVSLPFAGHVTQARTYRKCC